jgi:STE24 endopeptidase
MKLLIIGIFLATTAFGFFLKYLTWSRRNAPLPENVRDVFDGETYKKNQAYKMAKLGFSIVDGLIGMALLLLILSFNIHASLYGWISGHLGNVYLTSLFFVGVPFLAVAVIDVLVGIYDTFVIEARYGFNKYTAGKYTVDFAKNLLIASVLNGGLLMLFIFLYGLLGDWVFFAFFFVMVAFIVFMTFIYPFILRFIYKLTPLDDDPLKDRINALAEKTGYTLKGIYKVDASKRTTKLNAFASGFGKSKTIGLFDTMLEKMTDDEILSVLAHEIGHAKRNHTLKSAPFSMAVFGLALVAAYFIVTLPEVSQAFGFAEMNVAFGIYVLMIILMPLMLVLQIPSRALSRRYEYEADGFSRELAGEEVAVSALKTLYRDSFGNLTPHPFVVMMEWPHPPLHKRIEAIENEGTE